MNSRYRCLVVLGLFAWCSLGAIGNSWLQAAEKPKAPPLDAAAKRQEEEMARKATAMIKQAKEEAKKGDVDAAQTTLNNALNIANDLTQELLKCRALEEICKAQLSMNDFTGATACAKAIPDPIRKLKALSQVAKAQAVAGQIDDAQAILSAMRRDANEWIDREFERWYREHPGASSSIESPNYATPPNFALDERMTVVLTTKRFVDEQAKKQEAKEKRPQPRSPNKGAR